MKYLSSFNSYEVNEGWTENVLVGLLSLLGSQVMGQKSNISHTKTKSDASMKSLIKSGWSLDSTAVDTLYYQVLKSKPDTNIVSTRLTLDKDQFFSSGKYELTPEMKSSIESTLTGILNENGIIFKIEVESSTDKQGLSQNLQKELSGLGYSPDNKGLSKARCESVSNFLELLGVEDSLIISSQLFEKGESEVEQSARYVNVDFYYMMVSEEVLPAEFDSKYKVKKTYYLSKEQKPTGKVIKLKGGRTKTKKLGPIKNHIKRPAVKCAEW
jgi:outer membrane protein OmpA-like peptidoglycan-associated protein